MKPYKRERICAECGSDMPNGSVWCRGCFDAMRHVRLMTGSLTPAMIRPIDLFSLESLTTEGVPRFLRKRRYALPQTSVN